MVKARFRGVAVKNGDEIELPEGVLALSIRLDSEGSPVFFVTWLEEVKE